MDKTSQTYKEEKLAILMGDIKDANDALGRDTASLIESKKWIEKDKRKIFDLQCEFAEMGGDIDDIEGEIVEMKCEQCKLFIDPFFAKNRITSGDAIYCGEECKTLSECAETDDSDDYREKMMEKLEDQQFKYGEK